MKNIKYLLLSAVLIGFTACNDEEDFETSEPEVVLPALTSGSADFSKYVAVGASFTAGFSDSALFIAAQENSFPNILSQKFALAGGGAFTQPLMNDNIGGIAVGGTQLPGSTVGPRLVTLGGPPVSITSVIGPVVSSTDLAFNNPTGPFNNMGVPGAKSFHLLYDGYGNIANLQAGLANPYFVRMASSPTATMLGDAMAQNPTFFTLSEIGGNDVLGYATSGGDGSSSITPSSGPVGVGFDATFAAIIETLTSNGAKGVVTNVPYITSLAHFTTITYNPVPLDAATAALLNGAYAQYNGGLQLALGGGFITAEEAASRTILFEASATNSMVLIDEDLTDLTGLGLPNYRQSTANDLFVLPLSSLIPQGYGTQIPLEDKWSLTPQEQLVIRTATDAYNITIASVASAKGLALVDFKGILEQASMVGYSSGNFTLTTDLVTGGLISLDGIHLTSRGYALMANEFLKAIDATYGSNFIASGNVANAGDYPTNYSPTLQ